MTLLLFFFALAVILVSGRVVLRALDPGGYASPGGMASIALAFITGLGALSLQTFIYSLLSIPVGRVVVAAPWVIAAIAWCARSCMRRCSPKAMSSHRCGPVRKGPAKTDASGGMPRWARAVLLALIFSQVAYAFAYAALLPVNGWDAWAIWFLKARTFFIDGGVSARFLTDPAYAYSHADYPLLVPLSVAWVYTATGAVAETTAKLLWPAEFAALLAIFNWGVARSTGHAGVALLFTTLVALTPILMVHAAGVPPVLGGLDSGDYTGYADLMLSLSFLSSGVFIYLYLTAPDGAARGGFLAVSALCLAVGAWTKNEGLTFALAAVVVVAIDYALGRERGRPAVTAGRVIIAIAVLCAFILPWHFFKAAHGIGSDLAGGMNTVSAISNSGRLGVIIPAFADYMFARPMLFGLAWFAYPVSAAFARGKALDRPLLLLNLILLAQLAVYAVVYVITPADLAWHIDKSMNRLVMHLTPLCLFITALHIDRVTRGSAPFDTPRT